MNSLSPLLIPEAVDLCKLRKGDIPYIAPAPIIEIKKGQTLTTCLDLNSGVAQADPSKSAGRMPSWKARAAMFPGKMLQVTCHATNEYTPVVVPCPLDEYCKSDYTTNEGKCVSLAEILKQDPSSAMSTTEVSPLRIQETSKGPTLLLTR